MKKAPVVVVDYDPRWPTLYEEERDRILAVAGEHITGMEHIGSTAVPGLGAKPIIDIMAGLERLADAEECIELLATIGYEYVPEYNEIMPERRYFHKGPPEGRTFHLHMVELSSGFWERHLLFRDYLRAFPETAREYCRLKKGLADEFRQDRDGYTDAKTSFIEATVGRARLAQGAEQRGPDRAEGWAATIKGGRSP